MKFNCSYSSLVDISLIKENPKNPNKHPEKQIEMLAKIIAFQGQRSPLVISKRSGLLVKGHGRLEAIKKLGWKKVAIDEQDYESDQQELADMVADNKIAELSETNQSELAELMLEIDLEDINLVGLVESFDPGDDFLGDDDDDIDALLEKQNTIPDGVEKSHVKMVQLFFDDKNIGGFIAMTTELQKVFKTENLTDTIAEAVRRQYENDKSK